MAEHLDQQIVSGAIERVQGRLKDIVIAHTKTIEALDNVPTLNFDDTTRLIASYYPIIFRTDNTVAMITSICNAQLELAQLEQRVTVVQRPKRQNFTSKKLAEPFNESEELDTISRNILGVRSAVTALYKDAQFLLRTIGSDALLNVPKLQDHNETYGPAFTEISTLIGRIGAGEALTTRRPLTQQVRLEFARQHHKLSQ